MQKLKVKWLCLSLDVIADRKDTLHINMNYWIARSYYKQRGQFYDQYTWDDLEIDGHLDSNRLVVLSRYSDVLCFSCFQWNIDTNHYIAQRVKSINPNVKIIAGGPSCYAHKDRDEFFEKYPAFDYVVYGDGEKPFVTLLDHFASNEPITHAVNLIERDGPTWPFEVFNDQEFWDHSVVLEWQDDIKATYERYKDTYTYIKFHWETDRGCPYACVFCDWSSGLHNKVKRRRSRVFEELDFFKSMEPMLLSLPGANFGIFKDDIEIAKYMQKINLTCVNILYHAKLNKDRVWQTHRVMASYLPNYQVSASIQDINRDVLDAMVRPEIDWHEHKQYILDFQRDYPNHKVKFEVMIGMPLQTPDTMIKLVNELKTVNTRLINGFVWYLLPNSPGYDIAYQEKWDIKFNELYTIMNTGLDDQHRVVNLKNYKNMLANESSHFFKTKMVRSSCSFTFAQLIEMVAIIQLYNGYPGGFSRLQDPHPRRRLRQLCENIAEQMDETGLWAVYDDQRERFIHMDHYWRQPHVREMLYAIERRALPIKDMPIVA